MEVTALGHLGVVEHNVEPRTCWLPFLNCECFAVRIRYHSDSIGFTIAKIGATPFDGGSAGYDENTVAFRRLVLLTRLLEVDGVVIALQDASQRLCTCDSGRGEQKGCKLLEMHDGMRIAEMALVESKFVMVLLVVTVMVIVLLMVLLIVRLLYLSPRSVL